MTKQPKEVIVYIDKVPTTEAPKVEHPSSELPGSGDVKINHPKPPPPEAGMTRLLIRLVFLLPLIFSLVALKVAIDVRDQVARLSSPTNQPVVVATAVNVTPLPTEAPLPTATVPAGLLPAPPARPGVCQGTVRATNSIYNIASMQNGQATGVLTAFQRVNILAQSGNFYEVEVSTLRGWMLIPNLQLDDRQCANSLAFPTPTPQP